ncbi:MAG TPA: hypothetical protein VHE79_08850 [Spirochaetia bacterium]
MKRPFLLYLRSRLNLWVAGAGAFLIVVALVALRPYALLPILAILVAYAVVTFVLFFSKRGAHEIVTESDEDRDKLTRRKIETFAGIREGLAVMRLGDERVAKAMELFLQESGTYIEKCRELGSYSPVANDRIERVRDICQTFLDERDQASTARRYGGAGGEDPAERLAAEIVSCATVIRERVTEDLLGQTGEERLAIMKELEDKK